MGQRRPPGWKDNKRDFVSADNLGEATCKGPSTLLAFSGVGPFTINVWTVRAELEDKAANRYGLRGNRLGTDLISAYFYCIDTLLVYSKINQKKVQ